ncbi:Maf family protein [Thiocapsa marina]|uniref:dTTP/UTP pyrophosphatase n=1 Tax=Thiocapsa marina 5811 TaxID=768671 RepID=F9U7H8_9GAMM|nr:nucleoside triphosphate pyrophosphatase [Thiocapsa marina]EGV20204.1 Septum formation protein Maf [Thiocapsa marina 5811]
MPQTRADVGADHHLYLASRSPRRLALLGQIGVRVALVEAETDETRRPGESPETYVRRVALEKARAGRAAVPEDRRRPVLAADTAVVLGDVTLGKPTDRASAARMLGSLSGRSHRVLTAVALITGERELTELSESLVTFRVLEQSEILSYWETGEPCDKAGAYGIQGIGALFVSNLQGSYSGVMGLPLFETGRLLDAAGIQVIGAASGVVMSDVSPRV